MTYQEALDYIASLAPRGWRLGLDRMEAFVERAGLKDALGGPGGPQFIHVAGTNGKGSVTAYVQSILIEAGYRTGAFFSPFVYDPRERVQFGREYISERELAELTEELKPVAESFTDTPFGGITEFEFKAAIGFLYWKRKACEWVALEVGLGGRLDATNVVIPRASVIVSIGLDHTNILGHTHAEIAFEKAGVIKRAVPVVVGQMPAEALAVIEQVAKEQEAPIWRLGQEVRIFPKGEIETPAGMHGPLRPGIPGAKQMHNMALAVAAVDAAGIRVDDKGFRRGTESAFAPGRFQEDWHKGARYLLDGAHNKDAGRVLAEGLKGRLENGQKIILVTNMVAGHEPEGFYEEIVPFVRKAHVVPIDFHRAMAVEQTAGSLRNLGVEVTEHKTLEEGLIAAERDALSSNQTILVTGSFYLVGEVGRAIKSGERRLPS